MDDLGYYHSKYAKLSKTEWELVDYSNSGYENVEDFLRSIDSYIENIEKILGRENWSAEYEEVNGNSYDSSIDMRFVYGISRAIGGGVSESYIEPIVYLNRSSFEINRAPIVHELTHIIAPSTKSPSLSEGLACYIQDKVGENPAFPNHEKPSHALAKEYLSKGFTEAVKHVGNTGKDVYAILETIGEERRAVYIYSTSFTTFLINESSLDMYLQVYSSEDPIIEYEEVYGKSRDALIDDWIRYLENDYSL